MQDATPMVTVGIPTFNRPEGLERTLACITKQTYTNLEIIVSDNCSMPANIHRQGSEWIWFANSQLGRIVQKRQ